MALAGKVDPISALDKSKETWNIVTKVERLWVSPSLYGSKLPFSTDMVLMDSNGDKIHASVSKTLIYRFQHLITEGRVYRISFFGVHPSYLQDQFPDSYLCSSSYKHSDQLKPLFLHAYFRDYVE